MSVEKPRPVGTQKYWSRRKKQTYRPDRDGMSIRYYFYNYQCPTPPLSTPMARKFETSITGQSNQSEHSTSIGTRLPMPFVIYN